MKQISASVEDLAKYSSILSERPMSYRKINKWWREMIAKYGLGSDLEWSINFIQHQFIGKEKSISSSDR